MLTFAKCSLSLSDPLPYFKKYIFPIQDFWGSFPLFELRVYGERMAQIVNPSKINDLTLDFSLLTRLLYTLGDLCNSCNILKTASTWVSTVIFCDIANMDRAIHLVLFLQHSCLNLSYYISYSGVNSPGGNQIQQRTRLCRKYWYSYEYQCHVRMISPIQPLPLRYWNAALLLLSLTCFFQCTSPHSPPLEGWSRWGLRFDFSSNVQLSICKKSMLLPVDISNQALWITVLYKWVWEFSGMSTVPNKQKITHKIEIFQL